MADLFQHSIYVILANQAASGAYVACPNFPFYRYSWFRDGAFIAYAMDLVGEHASARRFHDWAARTILQHADTAERAIEKAGRGMPLGEDYLHTRYKANSNVGPEGWPDFQLDGLGTWLWALAEHARHTSEPLPPEWAMVVDLVVRYLVALWSYPCYDQWEEHPQHVHPYTLAAIYAGLQAVAGMATADRRLLTAVDGQLLTKVADEIKRFILTNGVRDGHLVKSLASPSIPSVDRLSDPLTSSVDASLIAISTPYRLLLPDDPVMSATVASIEADLHCLGGGVHRYRADTYYGGGEWVLLTAWLGWHYSENGEEARAHELLHWVEAQADVSGDLPEQVPAHLLAPDRYAEWEARWGAVAKPLLWSHAMYLVLRRALESIGQR